MCIVALVITIQASATGTRPAARHVENFTRLNDKKCGGFRTLAALLFVSPAHNPASVESLV